MSPGSRHADKRANHNAVERARRETLNQKFVDLAQSLPSLAHVRKPSKSVIVNRSIEFIVETKQRIEVKDQSLGLIRAQNEEFKKEINRLRVQLGVQPLVFVDNIDLDLIFEANLEHQREIDGRNPSAIDSQFFQQYQGSSFRSSGGSPYETANGFDDDEDDRASLMSPVPGFDTPPSLVYQDVANPLYNTNLDFTHSSVLGDALKTFSYPGQGAIPILNQKSLGRHPLAIHSSYDVNMDRIKTSDFRHGSWSDVLQ